MRTGNCLQAIRRARWSASPVLLLLLLGTVLSTGAAHPVRRPITENGGRVNQNYLWADDERDDGNHDHKGLDLSYGFGTDVYAVAAGTVVDTRANCENYTQCPGMDEWRIGNYVLVRHDQQHWNAQTHQWSYVYSLYFHLSAGSVRVNKGDHASAGTWIAEVDSTGQSGGDHLHFQVNLHPDPSVQLVPDTIDRHNTSRNPELWLAPLNSGGTNTGTVIGLYTDNAGNPVGETYICGLSKPAGSGGTTYRRSQTYPNEG